MLRTYSYFDVEANFRSIDLFNQEKNLATQFVKANPIINEQINCPACGSNNIAFFDTINDVDYKRCQNCYTIYIPVDEETINNYKSWEPILEYRKSKAFQDEATLNRSKVWQEFALWIHFRAYRYLKNTELNILDIGNKFIGLSNVIKNIEICRNYHLTQSIEQAEPANVFLYLDQLQCEASPYKSLHLLSNLMNEDSILILNMRNGSGFDILTLKGQINSIFPYEHSFLPSLKGLNYLFDRVGLDVLEVSTPGAMDVKYVIANKDKLSSEQLFLQYLFENSSKGILSEFQRFLQKSGTSSYTQIIARKKVNI